MKVQLILATTVLVGLGSCHKEDIDPSGTPGAVSLTEAEVQDLNFLIQEEKLARDVYLFAYQQHGDNIFNNIASSEQSHMDQVAALLMKYNQPNPVLELGLGEFENETLQQLYVDLIAIADNSSVEGFIVGATIEDLDIHDIKNQFANTINPDLISVYETLTCGSRNHMRSYFDKLQVNGTDYTPQYISQDEFDGIVSTPKETCSN